MDWKQDFAIVRAALAWHEYGSQDERRRKAEPALARLEDQYGRMVKELSDGTEVS